MNNEYTEDGFPLLKCRDCGSRRISRSISFYRDMREYGSIVKSYDDSGYVLDCDVETHDSEESHFEEGEVDEVFCTDCTSQDLCPLDEYERKPSIQNQIDSLR